MKNIIFFIIIISASVIEAQVPEDYLKMAIDSNPGLQARYAEFEAALQKIPQVKALQDPVFSVSTFGQMLETRVGPQQAIFILNQMFPWFGTLRAKGDAMALFAEAKFFAWLDARNELIYNVKTSWYPLYELGQTIKYQEENKAILETYKAIAETQFKNGKAGMVDVIRVDIMIDDIVTTLKVLVDKQKPLTARFNQLLNRNLSEGVSIADKLRPDISMTAFSMDSMLQKNPRLTELDKKAQAWKVEKLAAKREGMPKLGFGMNYTVIGKRTDMDFTDNGKDAIMPMFSLSLPLYRKKYKAMVKESEFMETSFEQMRRETRNDLLSSWEMASFEMSKALNEYELFNSQKEKTQQSIVLLLTGYSNSGKDFEEVLRMQQSLLKYEIATVNAASDFYSAIAKLEYLTAKK